MKSVIPGLAPTLSGPRVEAHREQQDHPEDDLLMVFTGWKILGNGDTFDSREVMQRLLPGVHKHTCQVVPQ